MCVVTRYEATLMPDGASPPARRNHAAVVYGDDMFVLGGRTNSGWLLDDVAKLHFGEAKVSFVD